MGDAGDRSGRGGPVARPAEAWGCEVDFTLNVPDRPTRSPARARSRPGALRPTNPVRPASGGILRVGDRLRSRSRGDLRPVPTPTDPSDPLGTGRPTDPLAAPRDVECTINSPPMRTCNGTARPKQCAAGHQHEGFALARHMCVGRLLAALAAKERPVHIHDCSKRRGEGGRSTQRGPRRRFSYQHRQSLSQPVGYCAYGERWGPWRTTGDHWGPLGTMGGPGDRWGRWRHFVTVVTCRNGL